MWRYNFDMFDDIHAYDRFGGDPYFAGDINRNSFAQVSQRALGALENAKKAFLTHLATVDTSQGPVTTEIIKFHLVPDMRKKFNKFVKEYGCTGISRQITRAEQDLINKSRKSLLHFTSVEVTPNAQREYLAKNPHLAGAKTASVASGSASSSTSETSSANTTATASGPLRNVAAQKLKRKLNEAVVAQASSSSSVKKINKKTA